jgi:hypothetical protein
MGLKNRWAQALAGWTPSFRTSFDAILLRNQRVTAGLIATDRPP